MTSVAAVTGESDYYRNLLVAQRHAAAIASVLRARLRRAAEPLGDPLTLTSAELAAAVHELQAIGWYLDQIKWGATDRVTQLTMPESSWRALAAELHGLADDDLADDTPRATTERAAALAIDGQLRARRTIRLTGIASIGGSFAGGVAPVPRKQRRAAVAVGRVRRARAMTVHEHLAPSDVALVLAVAVRGATHGSIATALALRPADVLRDLKRLRRLGLVSSRVETCAACRRPTGAHMWTATPTGQERVGVVTSRKDPTP